MAFDEKSGIVPCITEWGRWWQTIEEVYVEIDVPERCSSREIKCIIKTKHLFLTVKEKSLIKGDLFEEVRAGDSLWTLEDKKLIRIALSKAKPSLNHCWKSLLVDQYEADPMTYDEMEKKLTLERFQSENPGFDFSDAQVSGNYHGGGPVMH
ncbi:nudC domain-containing protein 2-like [Gigantopelta aegis]|uniref:nudC domain-containing protein 2-like n=1 Tax=Gigantopelta aegis TaxID=1735272 RepID=UPI001B888544|nr:nudC domain-containing protein 2-like [Gigantopelta aegis]